MTATQTTATPVTATGRTPHDPVDLGWQVLERCRERRDLHVDIVHPTDRRLDIRWDPMAIGHGDLGAALVFSAADERAPDDGWDTVAFEHIGAAVTRYSQTRDIGPGLFSGVAALAFTLRCLSRDGTRYRRAVADVDAELARRTRVLIRTIDPASGVASADYDMISGLSGVATYLLVHGEHRDLLEEVVACLVDLAEATGDVGGFWTPGGRVSELDAAGRDNMWAGYLNLGFAHGIAGVVSVLGQCVDRGVGPASTVGAVDRLADILARSADTAEMVDVPYHLTVAGHREVGVGTAARSNAEPSRYAWCYGNPGVALALSNSDHCASRHRDLIDALDNGEQRGPAERNVGNPSLCHGSAGALMIDRWVHGRDESVWRDRLLADHDPDSPLLLRNPQLGVDRLDSPGFLDGMGGAAVALLAGDGGPQPAALAAISGRCAR